MGYGVTNLWGMYRALGNIIYSETHCFRVRINIKFFIGDARNYYL